MIQKQRGLGVPVPEADPDRKRLDAMRAEARANPARRNGMHIWNGLYTWFVLIGSAFILGRFVQLLCCFGLRSDSDGLSKPCFLRVCFASFLPLIPLCLCWLPLRVYADWSETFYKVVPKEWPTATLIFVGFAGFVIGSLYMLASSSVWRLRELTPAERVIEMIKVAVGGAFGWLLSHIVLENPNRNDVFAAIHGALHGPNGAAVMWFYSLMVLLLAVFFFIGCLEVMVWSIKLLPVQCILIQNHDAVDALRDYFNSSRPCEITIGMAMELDWSAPPGSLTSYQSTIRRALSSAGL